MNDNTQPIDIQPESKSSRASRERARGRGEEDDEESISSLRLVNSSSSSSPEPRLRYFSDDETLVSGMVAELDIDEVDAVRAIGLYGLERVEGAVLKTMNSPGIHSPAGWFYSTLLKRLEWSPQDVELYAQRHGIAGAPRNRSLEAEWGRWATYLSRGERPPNYEDWTEPNRKRYDAALADVKSREIVRE